MPKAMCSDCVRAPGSGPLIAIAAHLDTVFPEGTDVKVKREGIALMRPGRWRQLAKSCGPAWRSFARWTVRRSRRRATFSLSATSEKKARATCAA